MLSESCDSCCAEPFGSTSLACGLSIVLILISLEVDLIPIEFDALSHSKAYNHTHKCSCGQNTGTYTRICI